MGQEIEQTNTNIMILNRCKVLITGNKCTRFANRNISTIVSKYRRLLSSALPRPENEYDDYEYSGWRPRNRNSIPTSNETNVRLPFLPSEARYQQNSRMKIDHDISIQHDEIQNGFGDTSIVSSKSATMLSYGEGNPMPITSKLHIVKPTEDTPRGVWHVFRMMVGQAHA